VLVTATTTLGNAVNKRSAHRERRRGFGQRRSHPHQQQSRDPLRTVTDGSITKKGTGTLTLKGSNYFSLSAVEVQNGVFVLMEHNHCPDHGMRLNPPRGSGQNCASEHKQWSAVTYSSTGLTPVRRVRWRDRRRDE